MLTDNEKELIDIIRSCENPERALAIATELLIDFINQSKREKRSESSEKSVG